MTDEQQAQRALTGKVEVFVGDKHIIANSAFGAISVKITRITEHVIHYDWDINLKTRWVWTHKNEIVSHAEFTRNLRDYLKSREAVERESVVLDLSETPAQQQGASATYQQYLAAFQQALLNKQGGSNV